MPLANNATPISTLVKCPNGYDNKCVIFNFGQSNDLIGNIGCVQNDLANKFKTGFEMDPTKMDVKLSKSDTCAPMFALNSISLVDTVDASNTTKVPTTPSNIPTKPTSSNGSNNTGTTTGTCTAPQPVKCFTEVSGKANMPPFISLSTTSNCWSIDTSTLTDSPLSVAPVQCGADEPFCVSFTGQTSSGA